VVEEHMDFNTYIATFQKSYSNKEEYERRKSIFERNMAVIAEHNANQTLYQLGPNKFTDQADDELNGLRGGLIEKEEGVHHIKLQEARV
jgi:hypothetical protein